MQYPGFCGGSNVSQSSLADGERTVNWYVEPKDVAAAADMSLYPTPGVEALVSAADSPGRGMFACDGRTFCVIGSTFYELTESAGVYALTSRGTVVDDGSPATMCWNGDGGGEVFITSGDKGYLFDLGTNTFSTVRTSGTTMGAALDGYFIALDAATSTIYLSDLLDGTTWDPTQYAQRSIASDPWVSMVVLDRYLWLLGSETSEVWYDAGAFPFPFQPHPSGLVPFGCAATFSPYVQAGQMFWLARTADGTGKVCATTGFTPNVVSSFAVSRALGTYDTLADAVGDGYDELGHSFYTLTLPTAEATWVYDCTTTMPLAPAQRWAERGTWRSEAMAYDAWRPLYHAFADGVNLTLDWKSGTVYRMAFDIGTDVDDLPIRRLRRAPALFRENAPIQVPSFEVFCEPGLGVSSGQGSDPQMSLTISKNGGKTWGNERWRGAGAQGDYSTRTVWLRNGTARRWMPEIVVTDPIPWRILGASITAKPLGAA